MSDAPEKIWACMGGPMVGLFVSGGNSAGWPEYTKSDLCITTEAADARAGALLAEAAKVAQEYFDTATRPPATPKPYGITAFMYYTIAGAVLGVAPDATAAYDRAILKAREDGFRNGCEAAALWLETQAQAPRKVYGFTRDYPILAAIAIRALIKEPSQ